MAHLREGLDRRVAGLAGEAVLARHDEDAPGRPRLDQAMGQHHEGEARRAAELESRGA